MLCACIDIGSNTTRLLVARCDGGALAELRAERAFTRIGQATDPEGRITQAKLREVAGVVAAQLEAARAMGVRDVRAVATAAVRRALNGEELLEAVRERCGLGVEVLSDREEARLAFLGATRTLDRLPPGRIAVVDVGGGSTELTVGTLRDGMRWWAAVDAGSGDLTQAYLRSDPPAARELEALRAHVAGAFAGLAPPAAATALAVGGSATSLRRLAGPVLDAAALERAVGLLAREPSGELGGRLGLSAVRMRLLPAAIVVLAAAAELLGRPLEVSRGGLREGVLLERAGSPRRAA